MADPLKAEQALGAWFHRAEIIPCYFLYQLAFQYSGRSNSKFGRRRKFHIDAGSRFIRFDDALKCNAGSPSFAPDHTALFLCACPEQLEPVRQDGLSTNFQTRTPRRIVNYHTIDGRLSRDARHFNE